VRVYHFIGEQWGLDALRRRRLEIALIDELNDPFELLAAVGPTAAARRAWQETRGQCAKSFGLLCFSKDWHNPVQWAHYADKHRGICLGFEISDMQLQEVSYARTRLPWDPNLVLSDQKAGEEFVQKILSTKFSHWRYEKEMRMFFRLDPATEEKGLYFADFSSELRVSEVIVGSLSSLTRDRLAAALGSDQSHVRCRKARLAFKSFKVVEQRKQALWL
jgi:Protein of unknown function (DUF2971)